jgi:hypothetical protein
VKWISFSWNEVSFSVWSRVANPIGYAQKCVNIFLNFFRELWPNLPSQGSDLRASQLPEQRGRRITRINEWASPG